MKIYFKNSSPVEIDEITAGDIKSLLAKAVSKGSSKEFKVDGIKYYTNQIKFFGNPCSNARCSRPERAHPVGEICEYDLTGSCAFCGKALTETDRRYAVAKFGQAVCQAHSSYGEIEKVLPGDDSQTRLWQGYAVGLMRSRGITAEEAVAKAVKEL